MRELNWPEESDCAAAEGTVLDEGWGREPYFFMPDTATTEENDEETNARSSGNEPSGRGRGNGFLIHIDSSHPRGTALVGVRNPELLIIEWIVQGRYCCKRFNHNKLRFPVLEAAHSLPPRLDLPAFDWNNQEHIRLLNNWRHQVTNRATGFNTREGSQLWSPKDIDFLVALTERIVPRGEA